MSDHSNAQLARSAWRAVSSGDVEALERMLAPDVVWHATARAPWQGDHAGPRAVSDFLARIGELMQVFDARLDDVLASADRVAMVFHVHAKVAARAIEIDYLLLARVKGGRAAEIWTLPLDPSALAAFFGHR
ncbi:MAG: nuclear transport factor 2 family protein [Deltaproteobacteria bacterium]|nr:nuclear transport factor 2 family protein [Deltaproteobacteria bacterium]